MYDAPSTTTPSSTRQYSPLPAANKVTFGDAQNNTLRGTDGHDRIYAGMGNDTVYGNKGQDLLYGGDGIDIIYGGKERDVLWGENGNDTLHGDRGNDIVIGGEGNDIVDGGPDNDVLYDAVGTNAFTGGRGVDTFALGIQSLDQSNGTVTRNTITDFAATTDKITIGGNLSGSKMPYYTLTQEGKDTRINIYTLDTTSTMALSLKESTLVKNATIASVANRTTLTGISATPKPTTTSSPLDSTLLDHARAMLGGQTPVVTKGVSTQKDTLTVGNSPDRVEILLNMNKIEGDTVVIKRRPDLSNTPTYQVRDLGSAALLIDITYSGSTGTTHEYALVGKTSTVQTAADLGITIGTTTG
jgi:RTX calcium-binding nonapeptide repeat (4 copies)